MFRPVTHTRNPQKIVKVCRCYLATIDHLSVSAEDEFAAKK